MKNGHKKIFLLFALLSAVAAALNSSVPAQGQSSCGCQDIKDLRSRACSASAAVAEWDRQIRRTRSQEEKSGQVEMMTATVKSEVDSCVDLMISLHHNQGENPRDANPWTGQNDPASRAGGATSDATCEMTVNAPTTCLADVIRAHENVHVQSCRYQNENRNLLQRYLMDFRLGFSSTTWMLEERTAYEVEHQFVLTRLRELSQRCPKSFFEVPKKGGGREFTLEWCPQRKPSPKEMENCKRQ